jgi:hypothetical protein
MDKDNLNIRELLGKRILLAPISTAAYATRVIEISPSGEYCALEAGTWVRSEAVIAMLAEVLPNT